MSQSAALLRLLEPAVRPVPTPAPGATPRLTPGTAAPAGPQTPFEAQSFDRLLATARQEQSPSASTPASAELQHQADTDDTTATASAPNLLNALADVGRIENPGLRDLLGRQFGLT